MPLATVYPKPFLNSHISHFELVHAYERGDRTEYLFHVTAWMIGRWFFEDVGNWETLLRSIMLYYPLVENGLPVGSPNIELSPAISSGLARSGINDVFMITATWPGREFAG